MPTIFDSSSSAPPKSGTMTNSPTPKPATSGVQGEMGPLTSFAMNPEGVRFETQEEQETVVLFLRQHVIVNVPWVLIAIVLAIAPTLLFPILFTIIRISLPLPSGYIFIGTALWYIATFGFVLAKLLGWFINIYIVTNERIVDIDFYYLLYKHFAEAELNKIQDISFDAGGIFAAIFDYGDVIIETAGEAPNLVFEKVPHPERVVETIRSLTEKGGDSL